MNGLAKIILNDILKEAESSKIPLHVTGNVANEYLNISFDSIVEGQKNKTNGTKQFTFVIQNYKKMIEAIEKYFSIILSKSHKWSSIGYNNKKNLENNPSQNAIYCFLHDNLLFLLLNATQEDLKNPVSLVERYTDFIMNQDMQALETNFNYDSRILDGTISMKLEEQLYGQETPYALVSSLKNDKVEGALPFIRFGISEENDEKVMYLYALQNMGKPLQYRPLYHLNKDVPEDLQTMSPNFVLMMGIVSSLMKAYQIETLYIPHQLPLKMQLKYQSAIDDEEAKKYSTSYLKSIGLRTKSQVQKIEQNMNERFIQNAYRLAFHGSHVEISEENPSLLKVQMNHKQNVFNNEILEELYQNLPEQLLQAKNYQK